MTVRWERFAGSTDVFAVRLAFAADPDAGHAADPAESASWGSIQIWVRGQNLCAHVDQGEVLQRAHWYLIAFFEWLAENWNPLLHEEKLPIRNATDSAVTAIEATRNPPALVGEAEALAWDEERYEWRSRHALRTARDGGLLPHLVLRRLRDMIELSWSDQPLAGAPPGFGYSAARGSALLFPEDVAQPLYGVLRAASDYLEHTNPGLKRITELQKQVSQIDDPRARESRLEWLAGLREVTPLTGRLRDASAEHQMHIRWQEVTAALAASGDHEAVAALLTVEQSPVVLTGSCQAALMFSSLSPTVSERDVRTLAAVMLEQYSRDPVVGGLSALSNRVALDPDVRPWEQGYELAEAIHMELDLDLSSGWVDIEKVVTDLGIQVLTRVLDDRDIRACCILGKNHFATIVRNETSSYYTVPSAQRFTLAHEFCHLLFDQTRGSKLAIASGPWAPRALEQRANAFAAMFLMPPELVENAIADAPDPVRDVAGIARIAGRLRVSRRAATDHLYNLTLMTESDRDELLRVLPD